MGRARSSARAGRLFTKGAMGRAEHRLRRAHTQQGSKIVLVDVRHSIPLRFLDSQSPDAACCFTRADQTCRWQQGMDRKGSNSAEPFRKILQKEKAKPPVFKAKPPVFKVMGRGRFSLNV
jgi:hypothetical protein